MQALSVRKHLIHFYHDGQHRLVCDASQCAPPEHPGGGRDTAFLMTPQLHCQDPGCSYTCRILIPVHGGSEAQLFHALHRLATDKKHKTLKSAIQSVHADAVQYGEIARLDPDMDDLGVVIPDPPPA